jgi:hypothetical protein
VGCQNGEVLRPCSCGWRWCWLTDLFLRPVTYYFRFFVIFDLSVFSCF